MLLSGYGLMYGYKLPPKGFFYAKRFARLYPTYLIIIIITYLSESKFNVFEILIARTGIGYYLPGANIPHIDWYVPSMYLIYLLFPFAADCVMRNMVIEKRNEKLFATVLLVGVFVGLFLTGILIYIQKGTLILTSSRIPVLFIGIFLGLLHKCGVCIVNTKILFLEIVAMFAICVEIYLVKNFDSLFLWRNGLYWLPFALIAPGLCFGFANLFNRLPKDFTIFLSRVGAISLEFYLLHIVILIAAKKYFGDTFMFSTFATFIFIIVSLFLTLMLSKLISKLVIPLSSYIVNAAKKKFMA